MVKRLLPLAGNHAAMKAIRLARSPLTPACVAGLLLDKVEDSTGWCSVGMNHIVIPHFNFSVIDVPKGEDRANDAHGSKIIVVPFDGVAFDREMQQRVADEPGAAGRKP